MQMTRADIVKEYREAANQRKQIGILAELNECTRAQIREVLEESGEKTTEKTRPAERNPRRKMARDRQIATMRENGMSVAEIAAHFGLCVQSVYLVLKKAPGIVEGERR